MGRQHDSSCQAAAVNQCGPIMRCGAEVCMVFGIPADDSCQFGAFVWAGQQKHFSVADVLRRLADGEEHDTRSHGSQV